jgi:hypothetical protein
MCFNKTQLNFIVKDIISKQYNDSILLEKNNLISLYNMNLDVCKNTLLTDSLVITEYKTLVQTYKKDSVVVGKKIVLLENNNKDLKTVIVQKDKDLVNSEKKIKRLKLFNKVTVVVSLLFVILINIYF